MDKKKIYRFLLMGPLSPPFTGQSVAFTTIVNALGREHKVKVLDISNRDNLLNSFALFFQIFINVVFGRYDKIYFTCSRSFFGSFRDVILMFLAKIKNIGVVNHLHGSDFKSFYRGLPIFYRNLYFWCYSSIESTIILIDGMQDEFEDFPGIKTVIVPNCYTVDLDKLPLIKEQNHSEIRLLYLSNLMKSKGVIHLLSACDVLFSKHPTLKLDIAGSFLSDSDSTLDQITNEFMIKYKSLNDKYSNRITYHGECKGVLKLDLLWKSDIFILPTFYKTEAFPISILEAMRAGNLILSTMHRYIPKIVNSSMGLLFKPNSVEEIVFAVEKVILDKNLIYNIQNFNIKYAIDNFNEQRYVLDIYKAIIN